MPLVYLVALVLVGIVGLLKAQPAVVALHRADSDTVVYGGSLRDLVAQARPGDTLYLPGGFLSLGADLVIDRRLHLVGAGFRLDTSAATGPTVLTDGRLILTTGASGGSLTGIWLRGRLQLGTDSATNGLNEYIITRCRFGDEVWLSYCPDTNCPGRGESLILAENVFDSHLRGAEGLRNIAVQNNFIGASIWNFGPEAQLRLWSNVFLGRADTAAYLRNIRGVNANYNVFVGDSIADSLCANINFLLNIFGGTFEPQGSLTESRSIENQGPAEAIFRSAPDFDYRYREDHDYRLAENSPGRGADIFRRDLGAYGGRFPFKPGAKPFNPHIRRLEVAPYTQTPNRLRVRFAVEAQTN